MFYPVTSNSPCLDNAMIIELCQVPASAKKAEASKPSLTPEEIKMKQQELKERARKKKEEEDRQREREREKVVLIQILSQYALMEVS